MAWTHIIGHESVQALLERYWQRGRLAHAYLFVGPQGIGKVRFAQEFAKALLCEKRGKSLVACDDCPSCHLVTGGTHPDCQIVRKPSESLEFPIEVMRELMQSLSLKPARGSRKIAIIDDADDLNEESSNCFLKTLEEPAPGSILILIGTSAELQLPTIRSRCQTVHFRPLHTRQVREVLVAQGIEDPLRRDRLIPIANGSPGTALELDDPELWDFRLQLVQSLAEPNFNPVVISAKWMEFVEQAGKEAAAQRARAAQVLRLVVEIFQQALHHAIGVPTRELEGSERQAVQQLSKRIGVAGLLRWLDRCLDFDRQIDRRVQLVLSVEGFIDALSQQRPSEKIGAVTR
ncbi:DNA polymerase III subunit delta' [Tuwongella immobilis]|uniref:AAA+ ATPase domain-containing protein n=1 Tax=Tuwongella immobilis TaxID=692036 RepID=A0A6C2YND2_9BACT|nr:DNA polymerase III subunit delta' [Tuwongella immobilis]VIP03130.1 dna polymerase iii subunit delta : DNA polymerase III, delta'' subunit OS=Singulisphaera acidiphila (strain ATCC BAA-1392 / DSM 18658 / VKM B-2454 / MOB10) GN=Sinac_4806 PE=4 SV=1: DNA_pol3_delta2 [Tuwongella immobilis]VTS03478.1 dna polymerase iii subunit delta : DNA polymerase III, delta'' subunit OS=Singulisphaera acidiphila (strain ATCC BAA-1392 / DSM 18658 / VKM B-2454 / MOB10) GN=Sinac_4806 PE=4 SV=1: DNA_pol3_delta2 [Tuw